MANIKHEPISGNFPAFVNRNLTAFYAPPGRAYYRIMLSEILERIHKRLRMLGLKSATASQKAGLHKDTIRNIERAVAANTGRRGVSTATIAALAPALNTSVGWLLEGTGPEELSDQPIDKTSNEAIITRTYEARSRANVTIAEMAKALGITEAQYKKFETTTPIAPNLVSRFCNLTRISADWLFSGESGDISEASSTSQREAS